MQRHTVRQLCFLKGSANANLNITGTRRDAQGMRKAPDVIKETERGGVKEATPPVVKHKWQLVQMN